MATIMTKRANTKRPMIMIRRKRGGRAGGSVAVETGRRTWFVVQPIRELLLQICCRCSNNRYNSEL